MGYFSVPYPPNPGGGSYLSRYLTGSAHATPVPSDGMPGVESDRTKFRVHFVHRHVQDTSVILD